MLCFCFLYTDAQFSKLHRHTLVLEGILFWDVFRNCAPALPRVFSEVGRGREARL